MSVRKLVYAAVLAAVLFGAFVVVKAEASVVCDPFGNCWNQPTIVGPVPGQPCYWICK